MRKLTNNVYRTPQVEGVERATFLVSHEGNKYLCYSVARLQDHWLLELQSGAQVEIWKPEAVSVHVPPNGWTFGIDGNMSRLVEQEQRVQLQ